MALRGRLRSNIALAAYTTWRIGGPAKQVYQPADTQDLCDFLSQLPQNEALLFLGLGSNTLIRTGGFAGTVVLTQGRLNNMVLLNDTQIRVEAGVACPLLARFCARQALQGAEFLAGIPGTLGGALRMNAGCQGQAIWALVTAVETINRQGQLTKWPRAAWQIAYREVCMPPDEWFVAAELRLQAGSKAQSLEIIRQLLAHRARTQPTHQPSCGSVFRNPPQAYAGELIERCGLKSKQIGGAMISPKHANFIVNTGHATSTDIERLMQQIIDTVRKTHHIQLIPEVHIIGCAR